VRLGDAQRTRAIRMSPECAVERHEAVADHAVSQRRAALA